jgi:hypothetical protein
MRNFILGCIVGAAGLYGSMCFHVVRANDGHHFVPKSALTFKDSYVDIRSFDMSTWRDHVPLAEAMMKSGKPQLVQESAANAVENAFGELLNRAKR